MVRTSPATTTRLAPGIHVVPRDDDHVQVGLDPPHRLVVRRHPDLLALLDDLERGRPPRVTSSGTASLLEALGRAGLLADGRAAAFRRDRPDLTRPGTVGLVDRGLGLDPLEEHLRRLGVPTAPDGRPPALHVLGSRGPVPRAGLDGWVSEGAPHLLLAGTGIPGSLRLGPLVEPGTTACLRCVDAAEADRDPRRTLVVEQLAARPARPVDAAVVTLGLAWAAREVAAYLAGGRPLTWSGTVDLGGLAPVVRTWERHPHCGCAWDALPY